MFATHAPVFALVSSLRSTHGNLDPGHVWHSTGKVPVQELQNLMLRRQTLHPQALGGTLWQ